MSDQSKLGIGQIITTEQHRDAIHVAVAPVVAAHRVGPGNHVGLDEHGLACSMAKHIGVIDPFLTDTVASGAKCWLFLYPGTITSLRHEWAHPAFATQVAPPTTEKDASIEWLRDVASRCGVTYERMMDAVSRDDYINMGENETYKDVEAVGTEEFDKHCSIVLGRPINGAYPFSCSC